MLNSQDMRTLAFGPVPSRRLGRSLGINNITPPKSCSYSCIYCQVGKTKKITVNRQSFYKPEDLFKAVREKVDETNAINERVDYITFVPDGEPTLDINISKEILFLKQIGLPIAVLTNGSLLWRDDVKEDLQEANFVSLKVDAVSEELWQQVNRPHKDLKLKKILKGIKDFTEKFRGIIVSETMLMGNIDYGDEFERIAGFLEDIKRLNKAYIAIPTRPPTENWVERAGEDVMNHAFQTFSNKLGASKVECLMGYEGNAFAFVGDIVEDLLSITAVHPMREEAVRNLLDKANADWLVVEKLVSENKLVKLEYEGKNYYIRKLTH